MRIFGPMANTSTGPIKLFVLGDAKIVTPERCLEPSAEFVFAVSLFFLLGKREPIARSALQELIWPNVPPKLAAHRLRQTLLKVRRCGLPIDPSGKTRLTLGTTEISRDYEDILSSASGDTVIETFSLDILPAYYPKISQPYSEWLDSTRLDIGGTLTRVVLGLIARARVQGNWAGVEIQSKRLLQFAPYNEEATLALAEAFAMRGEKLEAVRILDSYLSELGRGPNDLRLPASLMRRRIADRMPSVHNVPSDIPLLAREGMMANLYELLQDVQSGQGRACILWGGPGIGKSRLLTEFLAFSSLQGVVSHRIYCRSSDAGHPLAALLELIPTLRGMRGAIGADPETLAYLETLTKHRPQSNVSQDGIRSDEAAYAQLDRAIADLLGAVSDESPFILAIEDSHWMDSASATIMARLIARLDKQPVLMVFTSRGFSDGPLASFASDVQHLSVPALNEKDSAELVHCVVRQRGHRITATYLRWCTTVAEGNPYFLQELANHLVETGDEQRAPPSLTAVLRQRLSRLSPDGLQLLQTCALLENHATLDVIEEVLGYEGHRLLQAINELATAGMLASELGKGSAGASNQLNSRHDLLSDTALMQLAPAARSYLHRRAARVLEAAIDKHGDVSTLWSCAKHWQLAGDTPHALRLARSCAAHLLQAGLPHDASEAFDKAVAYCSDDAELLLVLEQQATAFFRCTAWHRVLETVSHARAIKRRLYPEMTGHDELELMELRAKWQTLNWNEITKRCLVCLSAPEASPAHRVEAGVMALMIITFSGDKDGATKAFEAIDSVAHARDIPPALLLQARMVFHTNWGCFDEATIAARELVAEQKASGNVGEVFRSLCNASVTFRAVGLFEDARNSLVDALAIADDHHLYLAKPRAISILANLSLELGSLAEARRWLSLLQETPIAVEDRLSQLELRTIGARIALLEGRADDAKLLVERDLADFSIDQVPHRRAYGAALRVAIELALRQPVSREAIDELRAAHHLTRSNVFQAFPTFALYAGLRSIGQSTEADTILGNYLQIYRREPWPAPIHLLSGLIGEDVALACDYSPANCGVPARPSGHPTARSAR